jgi:DNA primase
MSRISPETVEQVAAASDIVQVVSAYFPLKRAGTEFRALCPFHQEKSPSFYVSPSKQSYYCFGCGAGGSVFQFLMQYENVDFPEAVRRLAIRAGIPVIEDEAGFEEEEKQRRRKRLLRLHFETTAWFQRNLLRTRAAHNARTYLTGRGLNIEVAKRWQIGYAPDSWDAFLKWATECGYTREELVNSGLVKLRDENNLRSKMYDRFRGRLMFPICNDIGEVIAFSGRILDPTAAGAKYVNSPETLLFSKGSVLFGMDKSKRAIAQARAAIVLEGQLDLITAFEAGIQNVVAPQGTSLTDRQAALLRRFADEVVLFFDADTAGEKAAERALEVLFGAGFLVRIGQLPPGEDPDSLVRRSGVAAFRSLLDQARDFFDFEVDRNLVTAEARTTAGRVAFAHKIAQFISVVPDVVLRDTIVSRLAARLSIPRDAINHLATADSTKKARRSLTTESSGQTLRLPRHEIAVLCQILLTNITTLEWLRQQPWRPILEHVPGSELLIAILASDVQPDQSSSLASFLATLDKEDAAALSHVLAQKPIDQEVGRIFWTEFAARELRRRRQQLESVRRLSAEDPETFQSAGAELKEILDLESCITDISRLFSRAP